ncbi:MAG: hypothetical protein ACW98U_01305 [Candidatus Thorarchaeota archaeon]|jgi:hypothetical protein
MKTKVICMAIFAIVMLNALTLGANITVSPEYRLDIRENARETILSQEEEYNISSYQDFTEATIDVLFDRLLNHTDGTVFHAGDANWELFQISTSLTSYYWFIAAASRAYEITGNQTYSIGISKAANRMVDLFLDPIYPGFYVNQVSAPELAESKRAGVQAYAYWALDAAESVNASLDFTAEKNSAIKCLTDMLYDPVYGGFYFFTLRNGSLNIPDYIHEVYPNDGKRLDHLALGANVLYDVGISTGNSTLTDIAHQAISLMLGKMRYYYDMELMGFKLAVQRNGTGYIVEIPLRPAHTIVTDINAIAIRALMKGYAVSGNTTFIDNAFDVFRALLQSNWDTVEGGWFAETVDGEPFDPNYDEDVKFYKYSEIQFQMILALEDMYEASDDLFPIRMVIDTLELVLARLWEPVDEGFVSNSNQEWAIIDPSWEIHYTAVQAQAILSLERIWAFGLPIVSHVRVGPTNPRPHDVITLAATALDEDGIDYVYANYTLTIGTNITQGVLPLIASPSITGVFNNTLGTLPDECGVNFLVVANDTTGRVFVAGSYYFIVRADVFAPGVYLKTIYPIEEVRVGDNVVIDVETKEFPTHSHTSYCEIWWRLNAANVFTGENMTLVGVDGTSLIWRIVMGEFNGGDVIDFYFESRDEAGNLGASILYKLTILGPFIDVTPFSAFQILAVIGLVAAPAVGYSFVRVRNRDKGALQREGKKEARKRARRRGPRRRR